MCFFFSGSVERSAVKVGGFSVSCANYRSAKLQFGELESDRGGRKLADLESSTSLFSTGFFTSLQTFNLWE